MSSQYDILVDSDAFIGLFYPDDAHNKRSTQLFEKYKGKNVNFVTNSHVIAETATVLSHKRQFSLARDFLQSVKTLNFPVIFIDEEMLGESLNIFLDQEKRGVSVTDCINAYLMQRFNISQIFAFDKFYHEELGLKNIVYS